MKLDKAIQSRKSTRKFLEKKPDWRKIINAIDTARYAPMAGGNFSLKFIVVDDKDKIQKIASSTQQGFVTTAHYLIIVCSDSKRTVDLYGEKGKKYVKQQAGAAIQNILLKLTEQELGSCWIGHFGEGQIKRVLTIPKEINVECVIPVGHKFKESSIKKSKIDLGTVLYFNKYKNKKMKEPRMAPA